MFERLTAYGSQVPKSGIIGLVTLCIYSAIGIAVPAAFSPDNITNILIQTSYLAIFAAAEAIVIITRGLDLSIGSVVSLVSVVAAMIMVHSGLGTASGLAAGLGIGVLVGLLNGGSVAVLKVNPFIMTLATLNILLTLSTTASGGYPVTGLPDVFTGIASVTVMGVPAQLLVTGAVLIVLQWTLRCTAFGRSLYMIGSNVRAARVAGIPVSIHLTAAYVICSTLAALGALLLTARSASGEPTLGGSITLSAIAAAVLGGIPFRGGEGSITAPLIGALLVTVITNGLDLMNVNGFIQQIVLGLAILVALSFDRRGGVAG